MLPDADDGHVESGRRQAGHFGELVGRLEGVQDGREAGVEDVLQRQDGYPHGKNDINYGSLVNSHQGTQRLIS